MGRHRNEVVLVAGSTLGIGRAIALAAAAEEAAVMMTGRSEDKGRGVAAEIDSLRFR